MTPNQFTASATVIESETYEINGLNIWDREWKQTGQRVSINHNGQSVLLPVYEVASKGKVTRFVAFELSNNVWRVDHPYNS